MEYKTSYFEVYDDYERFRNLPRMPAIYNSSYTCLGIKNFAKKVSLCGKGLPEISVIGIWFYGNCAIPYIRCSVRDQGLCVDRHLWCPECEAILVNGIKQLHPPIPDWRPTETLPEDFYSI
jgi:hypothetical protein